MRKIIFKIEVSIDGFLDGPNSELDLLIVDDGIASANAFLSGIDTIFYGRITYEKFRTSGEINPFPSDEEVEFNARIDKMRKFVFSRTVKHVEGNGMIINENNLLAEVNRLRKEKGKNIWLCGGANIFSAFVKYNLIDEYVLTIQPRVTGGGEEVKDLSSRFTLEATENLRSGAVVLRYVPSVK